MKMSIYKKRKALICVAFFKKNAHYYYKFGLVSYSRTTFFKELIINRF